MNYMKEVAQILGLELYETFKIDEFSDLYRLTETGVEFHSCLEWVENIGYSLDDILTGKCEIIRLPRPLLTDEEKEYLSNAIKPFKEKVTCISKTSYGNDKEYIFIEYYEKINRKYNIYFPEFKKGTMYKGMELDKEYTLEDLGL